MSLVFPELMDELVSYKSNGKFDTRTVVTRGSHHIKKRRIAPFFNKSLLFNKDKDYVLYHDASRHSGGDVTVLNSEIFGHNDDCQKKGAKCLS